MPEGHYYVKDGENIIAELLDGYFYNDGQPMTSFNGGVDEVLEPVPSYEEWQASYNCMLENEVLRLKNAQLKEQINHLLKTQARQFVDNQKLQVKAEKAKDVVNIDTARQIKQLKELLRECLAHLTIGKYGTSVTPINILCDEVEEVLK